MKAIILSIGDELVLGQTVDTNSAWLSRELAAVGCDIAAHATVADNQRAIEEAVRAAASRCDVLLISGGLGPTEDDLTRQALAEVLKEPLELNQGWVTHLEDYFRQRGRRMPAANRIQAMIPRGATMIENTAGTAPGIDARYTTGDLKRSCRIFVMPGVPKEMKIMFARDVLPHIRTSAGGAAILSRTLHTFGLGESAVAEKLGELMRRDRNPSVGTTVSGGIVSLRINARFASVVHASEELARTEAECRSALGNLVFGHDEQTLQEAVLQLLAQATPAPTVTTAESCTGGLLAKMLTDVAGSSRFFQRGWVTYSNESKQELLGVDPELIRGHGAVSEPVARAMAAGARERAGADYALAISGIAGPDGGTPAKPVGTVCIALADEAGSDARTFNFPGDREWVRDRSAKMALGLLRYRLLGVRAPF